MFEHFVITRFNLKFEYGYNKDKSGKVTQTMGWLERRFELFDNYCFPSLKGQTCQEFKWLVLFDIDTPAEYKIKIDLYKKSFPNFYPLYLSSGENKYLRIEINKAINLFSNKVAEQIITTRIDNDDTFHKDMIKDVQLFFVQKNEECFLNFNYGIQYDLNEKYAVKMKYEKNHFISRMEKRNGILNTVLLHDHTQVDIVGRVYSIENKRKPMWIEIVHESNVSNHMRLSMPFFLETYFEKFNLNIEISTRKSNKILLRLIKHKVYMFLSVLFIALGLFSSFKKTIKYLK